MIGDGTKEDKEVEGNGDWVDDACLESKGYVEEGNANDAEDAQTQGDEGEEKDGLSTVAAAEDTMSLLLLLNATFRGE